MTDQMMPMIRRIVTALERIADALEERAADAGDEDYDDDTDAALNRREGRVG